jgi:hypothetical protein
MDGAILVRREMATSKNLHLMTEKLSPRMDRLLRPVEFFAILAAG